MAEAHEHPHASLHGLWEECLQLLEVTRVVRMDSVTFLFINPV